MLLPKGTICVCITSVQTWCRGKPRYSPKTSLNPNPLSDNPVYTPELNIIWEHIRLAAATGLSRLSIMVYVWMVGCAWFVLVLYTAHHLLYQP